jgi:hypothetical protein
MQENSTSLDTARKSWLLRHFDRYRERRPWSFCWRITIEGFLAAYVIVFLLNFLFDFPEIDLELTASEFLFICVLIGPIVETFIFQALPIFVARICRAGFATQIIVSMGLFAMPHFSEGFDVGIGAGIIGGFYSAFTYAHWRQKSRWTALWTTTVSHSLHNGLAFAILIIAGEFK